jgi:hypothetical protein
MAEIRIVEHEFTLFPKPEARPMGLIVGWKACATSCGKAGTRHGCPSSSTYASATESHRSQDFDWLND